MNQLSFFAEEPKLMMSAAHFSGPDKRYRDALFRIWDKALPLLVVCMLNPSTADHEVDDPTILTLIHFAKAWGYGGLYVVNLFSFRSPSPAAMMASDDPCGPRGEAAIDAAIAYARERCGGRILVAWGNDGCHLGRDRWFVERVAGLDLVCLGTTLSGAPKHPMARGQHRIPRDQKPIVWRVA